VGAWPEDLARLFSFADTAVPNPYSALRRPIICPCTAQNCIITYYAVVLARFAPLQALQFRCTLTLRTSMVTPHIYTTWQHKNVALQ
jgi:hypothetical protein